MRENTFADWTRVIPKEAVYIGCLVRWQVDALVFVPGAMGKTPNFRRARFAGRARARAHVCRAFAHIWEITSLYICPTS